MAEHPSSRNTHPFEVLDEVWIHHKPGTVYNCAVFIEGGEGGWTARSANLPSVAASGPTAALALEGVALELGRFIREHKAAGRAGYPWAGRPEAVPPGAFLRFVMVRP